MRGERLFRILGLVDAALIEEAGTASSAAAFKRRTARRRSLAGAACLSALCGLSFAWLATGGFSGMGASAPQEQSGGGGSGVIDQDAAEFMSYAGPVLPLTTAEPDTALTAERTITWDFSPGAYEDGAPRQWGAAVTDEYLLTNPTDQTVHYTALYPFTGSFSELASLSPAVSAEGIKTQAVLYAGAYSGGFQSTQGAAQPDTMNLDPPDSWADYQALLGDGSYLRQALSPAPAVNIPVTVYEFTDFHAPTQEYDAATQAVSFTIDKSRTTVLTYGFNGASRDEDTGWRQYDFFVPNGVRRESEIKLLVILGDDIGRYDLQGYQNGDTSPGNELEEVSCTVTRTRATLDAVLARLCGESARLYTDSLPAGEAGPFDFITPEMFSGAAAELLMHNGALSADGGADRYSDGRLDEILLETLYHDRVFYLAFAVDLSPGESLTASVSFRKAPSFDFDCSASENSGLQGYDLATSLGSSLHFVSQQAVLAGADTVSLIRQNFGFEPESGILAVPLDLSQAHYHLQIRPLGE